MLFWLPFVLLVPSLAQSPEEAHALKLIASACQNNWIGNASEACNPNRSTFFNTNFYARAHPYRQRYYAPRIPSTTTIFCASPTGPVTYWWQVGGCPTIPTEIGLLSGLIGLNLYQLEASSIPTQIGNLHFLDHLILSGNLSSLPTQIGQLSTLVVLQNSQSQIKALPTQIANLANLQVLLAAETELTQLPTQFGGLSSLTFLDLGDCPMLTSLPTQIGLLPSLEEFNLRGSPLTSLPSTIQNLSSLLHLYLPATQLTSFPREITQLSSLLNLDLSFLGPAGSVIPIPTQIGLMSNLYSLRFMGNGLASLPSQIGLLTGLVVLELDLNELTTIPIEVKNCPLQVFSGISNRFKELPPALTNITHLCGVHLDNNLLTSLPPMEFDFACFSMYGSFGATDNFLTSIPPVFFRAFVLDLTNNQITHIPTEIAINGIRNLYLDLNLIQSIPTQIGLLKLDMLYLSHNNVSSIPEELKNIRILDLTDNAIHSIPSHLSQFVRLEELYLTKNNISQFDVDVSQLIFTRLEIADNSLEAIGTIADSTTLNSLALSGNKIKYLPIMHSPLELLDLSKNKLCNTKSTFRNLAESTALVGTLKRLHLSNNKLNGSIPNTLSSLEALTTLVISYNELTSILVAKMQSGTRVSGLPDAGSYTLPSGIRCSIPSSPNLEVLDLSHNLIEFEVGQAGRHMNQLFADNYTFACDFPWVYRDFRGPKRHAFPIYIASPLRNLDLSFNSMNDDNSMKVAFVFTPVTQDTLIVDYELPALNIIGNRFAELADMCLPSAYWYGYGAISPCFTLPQDVNECTAGTHACPEHSNCTDGWYVHHVRPLLTDAPLTTVPPIGFLLLVYCPVHIPILVLTSCPRSPQMSYTCTCDKGYTPVLSMSLPDRDCTDIDECEESFPCSPGYKCINTEGSYRCERVLLGIYVTLPVFFGLVLLALVIFFLIRWLYRLSQSRHLKNLPSDVSWTWEQAILYPTGWEKSGGFLSKKFVVGSADYDRASKLFATLHFDELKIGHITAVYNKTLVSGFVITHTVQTQRLEESRRIFFAKNWEAVGGPDQQRREDVFARFQARADQYSWNKDAVVILPVVHGTDLAVAERIAKTGFAALSSVDAAIYSFLYVSARRQPALVISWILTGNPYPVVEAHDGQGSLIGGALKSGHQSHYIVTGAQGRIATEAEWSSGNIFDEVVTDQESQIAPAYILELDQSNFKAIPMNCEVDREEI